MRETLAAALTITDILFLLYGSAAGLAQAGSLHIPPEWMYADYEQPQVIAWNWSVLPVDLAFSVLGLGAVRAARRSDPVWRPLALLSLALTMVAGGTLPNLVLVVWPLWSLPRLIAEVQDEKPALRDRPATAPPCPSAGSRPYRSPPKGRARCPEPLQAEPARLPSSKSMLRTPTTEPISRGDDSGGRRGFA